MQIWITIILINIIHQTHVSAAPVDSSFGKIADAIINPAWTLNNPDSPNKNVENIPIDGEIDYPNTKNKKKNNSRRKNKRSSKKRNNNKTRNNRRRNNTGHNGRYLWYSVFAVDDLIVNLPEYRNHEDEQKIVLIWDDKRKIVQNEHVDALSMYNLNNNQLIRQKRDYNNILELQDNILKTKNINHHDLEENENSMSSNSDENINENMKFLNLRNSNTNKLKNILQNRKQPTNTIRNEISRPNHAQGLGIPLGADNSEKEGSQLTIIEENPQKINAITTLSNDKPELIIGEHTSIDKNTPEIEKIDTLINGMNSNSDEGADYDQDSESYPLSIETKNKIPNYSYIEDNKQHNIIKNIKHQFKPKTRKLEKKQPKNNDEGTLQTRFKPNAPSKNYQKTPSIDISEHKIEGNTDITKNIPTNDEIETLMNAINSNSEEDSSSENSDSNTSSSEKQQDIVDLSDLGDNKEKNLLKSIKQPLKPISKIQGKAMLENNEKLPEIYEKYLNNPSEINTKNKKGSQQIGNTPASLSINNQQTPSTNVPGHITPEHTDVTKNIPVNDEIETLMNAINLNSEEGTDDQNSEPYSSSLETKQEIPNNSDVGDNKQHDILKNIEPPFNSKSRKLGKLQPKNNDKGTLQTRFTPNAPSKNYQKTPSIDIPERKTEGNTDISQNIPSNVEIETLMNAINLNSEEGTDDQNSEPYSSSLETKQEIPNYSDVGDNKQHDILKNIEPPFNSKSRKLGKLQPKNNDKGTLQTRFTPNAPSKNYQKTPSIDIPERKTEGNTDISQNIPSNVEIETLMNAINLNSEEGTDDQNSEPYSSSLETKQEIPNYSDVGDNKQHDILKNIEPPFNSKSRKLGKLQPKNNDKGTLQTRFTPNAPSKNYQKTPSIDIPEHKIEGNTDIAKNIPTNDEIETLMNAINSNSEEDSSSENSDSNTSSSEKQQDIVDLSDLGDNKEKNLLKSIKQPLKHISKIQGKAMLENNEKLPEIYEKYLNNSSEINTKNKKGSQQIGNTPTSLSINNQQTPSTNVPGHITPEHTDVTENIPVNDEIETLMNAINSDSKEGQGDQNSELNTSSLETKQEIPNYSDAGDNKQHDILKNIEPPFKPKSRKLGKIQPKNNDKGTLQTIFTTNAPSKNNQKTPSIDIPEHKIEGNTDIAKNIPVNDEIDTLINIMHSNSEEDSSCENSDSNTSSSEKQQDIVDISDLGDNKEKNLLKSIKQPLKPLSKMQEQKLLENNEKLPGIYKQKFYNSLEINKNNEEGPQQKPLTQITHNLDQDKIKSTPAYDNFKPNIIQKKKSIKTPDLVDTIVPQTTDIIKEISTGIPIKDIDETDSLEGLNNLGGITMEDADVEKVEDKSHSSALDYNNKKDHDDVLKKINQPIFKNQNTGKSNTKYARNDSKIKSYTPSTSKNIEKNPKHLIEGQRKKKLDDKSDSNSIDDLLSSSISFDEVDLSQSMLKKKKVNPKSKTSNTLQNSEDTTLKSTPRYNDLKPKILQKNKSIKTIDLMDTIDPETTNAIEEISIEIPLDDFGDSDSLQDQNNIRGITMKGTAMGKTKDKSPSSVLNNKNKKDHKDSLQKINQNPNRNIHKTSVRKNKSMQTPDLIGPTAPKSTEKVIKLTTDPPLNDIDVSDPLEEYNKFEGFTMEDAALEKIKDESPSTTLNYNSKKYNDDSLQVTNQPMLINPNTVYPNTDHKEGVHTNIDEIPKDLSDGKEKKKLVDEFGSNSYADLFGGSLDFYEEDLSQPGMNKKKVIPISKTNDIIKNVEDDKLQPIPTNNDDISKINKINKSIKTPDLIDTTFPKSTEKVIELTTETPLNEITVSDPLEEYNKFGGFTMEDAALETIKDESPSTTLNYNSKKYNDDSLQVTNQPMLMNPNTVNSNIEYEEGVDTNIDEISKDLSDGKEKNKLIEEFGSNSYADLFGGSLDFYEEDLSQPGMNKKKVIPISITNDIIKNVEDDKLQPIPTNNDDISKIKKINESIKTPDLIDITFLKSTEKVIDLTTEMPLNEITVSDPLEEYNKFGGFTMEDAALEKIKDESPSTTLNYNSKKYNDDSLQVTNQPMLMNPNTVNSNIEYKEGVDTNIDEIPKDLSDGKEKKKLVDEFGSNSYADLFGGSLDFNEEDLSQPGMNKKKVIPISKTNDIIKNVEDDKLQPIPTNNDDISKIKKINKSIKTPDFIGKTVPKSTEKIIKLSIETPLNDIDVSDPLEEYNKFGGFTMEDAALETIKDEFPSMTLNYNSKKYNDDSLQVTNQPILMNPKTVYPNTDHKEGVHINIDEIPKNLSDGKEKKKLDDEFGSNSYADLFGGSLDFNEEDLSQPGMNKKKVISISKTNDIIKNVENEKLQPIPTNNDDISNIKKKKKSIKTPDLIDITFPKSTEKVIELTTEMPLNDITVSDPLEEYNKFGGFTMEDAALETIKDESPSTTLNYNSKKYNDDSLQVTNQPMLMKPNTVNSNIEYKEGVDTNIDEIPKDLSDGKEKNKLVEEFGSNSYADLFGGSLDFYEEDLSQPGMNKKKVIPISKTNDIIKNVENEKLQPIPTNNDDISNIKKKKKSIKTPDLIDITFLKSTEKVIDLTTEMPLNEITVSDPLEEYNKFGGFTMEDASLEKIKDESPSTTLNYNSKKYNDDSLQVTNQPMLMNPNTVNSNIEYKEGVDTNIDEIPKDLSDGKEKKKLVDEFGSNSYADLFGGSLDFNEEDLSQPGMNKKKVIPISKTNDIIKNVEDDKLQPIPTINDDISKIKKINKSIKTPDFIGKTVTKSTEKIIKLSIETPLNDIDVSDPLEEYNKFGGFTMEDAALETIKDEFPSTTLNYNSKKYNDDSLQVTNQPILMNPKTVYPNTDHKEGVHINIDEIPKNLSDGKEKKKLDDEFGSNSYADLFGGSLDFNEEDLSQPGMNKKKVISISKTNDIIKNVEDDKLQPIPTINDDISKIKKINKSIKTPDFIGTTVPKSTEKIIKSLTETPLNDIDVSDPIEEYNKFGGFTKEDAALETIKDESPSTTLNYNSKKYNDDSLQVTNQPMLINPNTVYPNTDHKEGVHTNIDEIPKDLSDGKEKKKLVDEFGSNSYADLFGGSLDFYEEDLSQPGMNKKKVIPISKTNDIIKNAEDDKLQPILTNNDDISKIKKINKSIKTPDLIDTTFPKSTEKVIELTTETPLNEITVSDPLEEYNKFGGFTMEDAALETIKDESPSTTLNYNSKKYNDDSLQVTNQPMLMNPNTVNSNIEYEEGVDTNIDEIPKDLSDGKEKKKLVDEFGSNSYADLFGGSLDFYEDLSQPGMNKKKVIPISKTNDIIKNVEDDKLQPIPTINDDISKIKKINKSIKTPDFIGTTVPKSTEKIIKSLTETPLNDIDVSDPIEEYNKFGGFTKEDAALETIKDESPSTTLNYNSKKYNDDSLQVTNQPILIKPKTVNSNIEYKDGVDTNIDEIPKDLSDGKEKKKLVDEFGSNSYADLFGGSLDFYEEDLSQPGMNKKKVIPISKTNDIIKNVEDDKLQPIPTNNDDISKIKKINKSIKTPDFIGTSVPKSTEKIIKSLTETPLNDIDVSDPLEEYNKFGGFTMGDAALETIKDESPSTTLNLNSKKYNDDSLQVTNQPILIKPKTVNSNMEYKDGVDTNIDEIPKYLSDGKEKKKLVDEFGSKSYADLFGGSLDFYEEDLSQPGMNKKKVIPISKTNDIIKNVEDDKLQPIPTNNDDISKIKKINKSIKTPDFIGTTFPKSTEKVIELTTETPLNDIDLSDPLEEYIKFGGFTMEDAALETIKDVSPSTTLNYNSKKEHDDNFQKMNEPKIIYPVTEEAYTKYNVGDVTKFKTYTPSTTTNNEEIPKNLSGSHGKIMLDNKINSNPIDNFLGSSISFDKIKLPLPGYEDKDVITKPGYILPNLDDVTLISALTDDDIKPNSLQKNKFIKKLNPVSNTDSKMLDLIEPTTQTNYDIIKNDNKLPLSKIPSYVIDKHSSNSNTIHYNNNNLLDNDKDVTFNRSLITNHCVEYNSKDLSSLEDGDRYGYMLPKFSTKYSEGGESNYILWETIPPKKNDDVSSDKGYDNLINDFNQSSDFTTKNNKTSSHSLNENNIVTGTESVKNNNYNIDKVNTNIHNKQYDDLIKKMSEQLFKKIDNIDDKLAKLDKVSHNSSYVKEIGNIGSHEPTMNNVLLSNGIPISKPEKVINIEDSYSKTNKPIESLEINTSNKSDDENEINKNESPKAKKHKNKKHKRHGNKKKDEKNNASNDDDDGDDDDDDDDDDDYDDYDGNHKKNKRHENKDINKDDDKHKKNKRHKNKDLNNDDDGKHKKNKRHKNKDINKDDDKHKKNKRHKNKDLTNDDDGKHKHNKRHKNTDINNDDGGKHKKNKRHKNKDLNDNDNGKHNKKNKKIDDDNDNGGHRKKSHIKIYSKVDDDVVSKHKKHKSHKKKDRNYNDVEILQSKITDNKKRKKIKENVYSTEESNDVNYSSSIQINSENNDSAKRLKTTSSKSKISKKTNSTKSKKSSPKKKSKYVKHSKTIKYKNKEIPVDVSDEDTSSNENNYNSEKTYIKYISNNNQNNVPKDNKHKHKTHNKHSRTSKTYIYKKIPEDKDSNENSVNLEETYNINIISDDDALRQKKHRHKKYKKKKNFDINIVKDTNTDTDTQVLNNDKKPLTGYQFYTFYPQYRYATLNPFARLLTNSYLG